MNELFRSLREGNFFLETGIMRESVGNEKDNFPMDEPLRSLKRGQNFLIGMLGFFRSYIIQSKFKLGNVPFQFCRKEDR